MAKSKPVIFALIVVMVVSLGFNIYQYNTNHSATQQNQESTIKQEMVSQLMHTQNNVNSQLASLDSALMLACRKLSTAGLTGTQAETVLSDLAANSSLIVSASSVDTKGILVATQPSRYSGIVGEDISMQEHIISVHETMMPAMSNMIPLVEGFPGAVMAAPIFDSDNRFMGSISIVIQPSALINQSIASGSSDAAQYSMWAMQANGTLIYDPDPAQQGKNLLTDPIYAEYPEVQAFAQQVSEQQSGFGSYKYYVKNLDQTQNQVVAKEAYWITIGIYDTEWRLVIWHALNP
jgi:hypothetical protein